MSGFGDMDLNAPASAEVHRMMLRRMQSLTDVQALLKEHGYSSELLTVTVEDVRQKDEDMQDDSDEDEEEGPLQAMSDAELEQAMRRASSWLLTMLAHQEAVVDRELMMGLMRRVVEKAIRGRTETFSDMEVVYMALTTPLFEDPQTRLNATFMQAIREGFAERLERVRILAAQRVEALDRIKARDAEALQVYVKIAKKAEIMTVDRFACAIHLSELKPRADIVDDNEGCCPICQNSYTVLSITNNIQDILSDFPVRIKYCGHVVGRACLEQWMVTPKIDEARYPRRTCPTCRVEIEGVRPPTLPHGLESHVTTTDRRAQDTLRELLHGYGLDTDECLESVLCCMSDEIAIEQVLGMIAKEKMKTGKTFDEEELMMLKKLEEIGKEKWVWGFKGDGVWKRLREEWMKSHDATKKRKRGRGSWSTVAA